MSHITADDNDDKLKRETQISCIVRSDKMLMQSIWMTPVLL